MSSSHINEVHSDFSFSQLESYGQTQILRENFLKFEHPSSNQLCQQMANEIGLQESEVIIEGTPHCNVVDDIQSLFPNNEMAWMQLSPLSSSLLNESARNMIMGDNNITSLPEVHGNHSHRQHNQDFVHSSSSHIVDSNGSRVVDPSLARRVNMGTDIKIPNLIEIMVSAKNELLKLMKEDEYMWMKDMSEGRYVINRRNYNRTFSNEFHRRGGNVTSTRFESSKDVGFISINARKLVTMLADSKTRLDIFSTILTESIVLQEYAGKRISSDQLGPIQLVYEQMHVYSPLLEPRGVYYLRCCEKISAKTWVIVEVSYDPIPSENMQLPNRDTRAWRLASGCLIKEAMPTLSKITWVEHTQVDDRKAILPRLYRDVVFRGLSFDANRFLQTLLRYAFRVNCHLMFNKVGVIQHYGLISCMTPKARKVIVEISYRMIKNFGGNLTIKEKIDLPYMFNDNIRFSICKTRDTAYRKSGFLINAATSMWIPLPFKEVVGFLNDVKLRSQWDVLCNKQPGNQIATITYGKSQENSIALIQPRVIESIPNLMVIQETLSDPLGAVVLYAPIEVHKLQKAIDEANNPPPNFSSLLTPLCGNELTPSGFIIYKDGSPGIRTATSKKSYTYTGMNKGSLVTAVFQVLSPNATSFETVDLSIVSTLHSLVTSTVQNIRNALNCNDHY